MCLPSRSEAPLESTVALFALMAPVALASEDNLGKGAAGQAIQTVNLAYGYDETAGLRLSGVLV